MGLTAEAKDKCSGKADYIGHGGSSVFVLLCGDCVK